MSIIDKLGLRDYMDELDFRLTGSTVGANRFSSLVTPPSVVAPEVSAEYDGPHEVPVDPATGTPRHLGELAIYDC